MTTTPSEVQKKKLLIDVDTPDPQKLPASDDTSKLPRPPRTRFAPSPTGFLHIGNLRNALYPYLFARKHGGQFIVRVEDTDQSRAVEGAVENMLRTLSICGIHHDEGPVLREDDGLDEDEVHGEVGEHGPYHQSARLEIYDKYVDQLLEAGHAYPCFCTPERLEEMRREQQKAGKPPMYDRACLDLEEEEIHKKIEAGEPMVIRMKVPDDRTLILKDKVHGSVKFHTSTVDDQVLMKSDHFPTYHLANVVDDHLMEITHVIRGDEWLPSSPKHLLLYEMFGWESPEFVHVPLLLNPDKTKLSKRQGSVSVEDFFDEGYLPEAIVNFIALLGWNPKTEQELFHMNDLMDAFSLEAINKAGAVFDRERLDWMNQQHIKEYPDWELLAIAHTFYDGKGLLEAAAKVLGASNKMDEIVMDYVMKSLTIERERLAKLTEIGEETDYMFVKDPDYPADRLIWKKSNEKKTKQYLQALHGFVQEFDKETWESPDEMEKKIIAWIAENKWKNGDVLWPLRVALTGKEKSPGPFDSLWALGEGLSLERIELALDKLSGWTVGD